MGTTFRLALRNLKEHKSKTIIISLFLVFGVAIVVLGNSFLESVNRGLEKDFRANYTGDLVISMKPPKGTIYDIAGVNTTNISGEIPQMPALNELDKISSIIEESNDVVLPTKQISAQVLVAKGGEFDLSALAENDDLGLMDYPVSLLFGIEQETYWKTFPDINIKEGTFPAKGTNEILVDTRTIANFEKCYHETISLGDVVLVAGANTNGVLREGKICGIFTPPDENSAMFAIIYSEPGFARAFADLTYGSSFKEELPDSVDLSISSLSEDDLFGSDEFDFGIDESNDILGSTDTDFSDILGDTTLRDELNKTDDGAWNFIIAKVKNPRTADKVIAELNKKIIDAGINDVQVMNWKQGAYSYTQTVEGIGLIFNILIIILAVVVFIIIMNTMTVSVIERTGEIGTMRAIGAEKSFVRKLFFTESIFLTLVSSVVGIILAFILMGIFNSLNIVITNEIAKMILGGGLLKFSPTAAIIIATIVIAGLGSILSNIYPVSSALKITPLKALSKGSD